MKIRGTTELRGFNMKEQEGNQVIYHFNLEDTRETTELGGYQRNNRTWRIPEKQQERTENNRKETK